MNFIVLAGTVVTGVKAYGPFTDSWEARNFADTITDTDTVVIHLIKPEELNNG